jgi:asparaginyl-tRNA synthetase
MKQTIEDRLEKKDITKRLASDESAMIASIESALVTGAMNYCENTDYKMIIIPHMTKATGACENFSTLFSTELFGQTAYLNQTGQLMLEAFLGKFPKTYCFGPSFRKERDADSRHLIEFPLFEIEVKDLDLQGLQKEVSNIFLNMIENVEYKCADELELLTGQKNLDKLKPPYNSITYTEAVKSLSDYGIKWGDDLKALHEHKLVSWNDDEPLFITHYPQEIKFFNMRLNRDDKTVVNSMDLLMPYSGESVGAAEREENHTILLERLLKSDMYKLLKDAISKEPLYNRYSDEKLSKEASRRFDWYMNIIKENPVRHAGCGIGINRVSQAILQTDDIRNSTAFPMNKETLF